MKFGSLFAAKDTKDVDDGEYCFALMPDYGTVCKAVSERFQVVQRKVLSVVADSALFSDSGGGIHRQDRQKSASLGLISVNKVADQNAEVEDERCYFPVPSISVHLGERFTDAHPVLKDIYRIVDKESFLDWGLTSDYLGGEAATDDDHRLRKKSAPAADAAPVAPPLDVDGRQYSELLPAAAPRAKRGAEHTPSGRGLGGGTLGSEGYGEATMASCARLGVLLQNLRQLVLHDLCPFIHWGLLPGLEHPRLQPRTPTAARLDPSLRHVWLLCGCRPAVGPRAALFLPRHRLGLRQGRAAPARRLGHAQVGRRRVRGVARPHRQQSSVHDRRRGRHYHAR